MSNYNSQRYYWIKLTDRFMTSDTVDFLMEQTNGAQYVVLYQMLCLKTVNQNGELSRKIGEIIIPYDEAKIQRDLKYFSIDTVRIAMSLYKRLGLIYEQENGVLKIANFENMIASQTISAEKKQEQIARRNEGGKKVENFPPDKEKDKEKEKDRDKELSIVDDEDNNNSACVREINAFCDKYGIILDNGSWLPDNLDIDKLEKAWRESEWLRKNIKLWSQVGALYEKIIAGGYMDFKKVYNNPTKTRNERTYTKEELDAMIQNANEIEF